MMVAEQYFSCESSMARATRGGGKQVLAGDDEVQVQSREDLRISGRAPQ